MKPIELAVIIPVYNEEQSVTDVVVEWVKELDRIVEQYRILVLDDGSRDGTPEVLKELSTRFEQVEVITKSNSGHGQTCIVGYGAAIERGAEWVFQIDSDGQCDPSYFGKVWEARVGALAVMGHRMSRDDGLARKLISRVCGIVSFLATGTYVCDTNVPYRLIKASVLCAAIHDFPSDFNLANILLSLILRRGLKDQLGFVPIGFRDRSGGEPSVKWASFAGEGWRLACGLAAQRGYLKKRAAAVAEVVNAG